ncbi:MAG: flagellar biosynthesis protein FlhF [bacterium]
MKVKRYEAGDMQEAIRKVRADLGENALILSTRKIEKKEGLYGLFGRQGVEVTAISENNLEIEEVRPRLQPRPQPPPPPPPQSPPQPESKVQYLDFYNELQEIKELLKTIKKEEKKEEENFLETQNDFLIDLYQQLRNHDIEEVASVELTKLVRSYYEKGDRYFEKNKIRERVQIALNEYMEFSGQIKMSARQTKIVALVGPTGVGKTTTVAKLAANYNLESNKSVTLFTFDTYRIAAIEQIKTYAKILEIPLEVITSSLELRQAVQKHKDKELILIDTAGHKQQDKEKMQEMFALLRNEVAIEVHLVISTTTSNKTLYNIAKNYEKVQIDKLIFTKLDEAVNFGVIINTYRWLKKPLSYFTTGQGVPDDIEIANSSRLGQLVYSNTLK